MGKNIHLLQLSIHRFLFVRSYQQFSVKDARLYITSSIPYMHKFSEFRFQQKSHIASTDANIFPCINSSPILDHNDSIGDYYGCNFSLKLFTFSLPGKNGSPNTAASR